MQMKNEEYIKAVFLSNKHHNYMKGAFAQLKTHDKIQIDSGLKWKELVALAKFVKLQQGWIEPLDKIHLLQTEQTGKKVVMLTITRYDFKDTGDD